MRPPACHAVGANDNKTREVAIGDANLTFADVRADVRGSLRDWQQRAKLAMDFHDDLSTRNVLGQQRGDGRNVWARLILNDRPLPGSMLYEWKVFAHQLVHAAWVHAG
jgi:hypothetical protein